MYLQQPLAIVTTGDPPTIRQIQRGEGTSETVYLADADLELVDNREKFPIIVMANGRHYVPTSPVTQSQIKKFQQAQEDEDQQLAIFYMKKQYKKKPSDSL